MLSVLTRLAALVAILICPYAWSDSPDKIRVLCSVRPITLLVSDLVAGLPVEVETLLPANADPHNWSMRISDRQKLETADLVVWLGPNLENFLLKSLAQKQQRQTLELGLIPEMNWPTLANEHHEAHSDHATGKDMHLWLNPSNAAVVIESVAKGLAQIRPELAEPLARRSDHLTQELTELKGNIAIKLAPYQEGGFIAVHDAYGHFVSAFGLHQLSAVNQSSEQRLSAKKRQQLQISARAAKCLMAEQDTPANQRLADSLHLPLKIADGLGRGAVTYKEFIQSITDAFVDCLRQRPQ